MIDTQTLLNADGTASMSTLILMSHHAFRRDVLQLERALATLDASDPAKVKALQEEWTFFRGALHGHHEKEDADIFPALLKEDPNLRAAIDELMAEHREIDPLLVKGDAAFAELTQRKAEALHAVEQLEEELDGHLAFEESQVVSLLRGAKEFPPPLSDEEAVLYADGFAWSSYGIAEDVLAQVFAMLPASLREKLPGARAKFAKRCESVWGSSQGGSSRTCIPEWLRES